MVQGPIYKRGPHAAARVGEGNSGARQARRKTERTTCAWMTNAVALRERDKNRTDRGREIKRERNKKTMPGICMECNAKFMNKKNRSARKRVIPS